MAWASMSDHQTCMPNWQVCRSLLCPRLRWHCQAPPAWQPGNPARTAMRCNIVCTSRHLQSKPPKQPRQHLNCLGQNSQAGLCWTAPSLGGDPSGIIQPTTESPIVPCSKALLVQWETRHGGASKATGLWCQQFTFAIIKTNQEDPPMTFSSLCCVSRASISQSSFTTAWTLFQSF